MMLVPVQGININRFLSQYEAQRIILLLNIFFSTQHILHVGLDVLYISLLLLTGCQNGATLSTALFPYTSLGQNFLKESRSKVHK